MMFVVVNITAVPELRMGDGAFRLDRKEKPEIVYVNEEQAEQVAAARAAENPGKQFAVMKISRVFETTTPKIITKVIDNHGQLVREQETV